MQSITSQTVPTLAKAGALFAVLLAPLFLLPLGASAQEYWYSDFYSEYGPYDSESAIPDLSLNVQDTPISQVSDAWNDIGWNNPVTAADYPETPYPQREIEVVTVTPSWEVWDSEQGYKWDNRNNGDDFTAPPRPVPIITCGPYQDCPTTPPSPTPRIYCWVDEDCESDAYCLRGLCTKRSTKWDPSTTSQEYGEEYGSPPRPTFSPRITPTASPRTTPTPCGPYQDCPLPSPTPTPTTYCATDRDCDDGISCSTDHCSRGLCAHTYISRRCMNNQCSRIEETGSSCNDACASDRDCHPTPTPTPTPMCTYNTDCDDNNICTDDICDAEVCSHPLNCNCIECPEFQSVSTPTREVEQAPTIEPQKNNWWQRSWRWGR